MNNITVFLQLERHTLLQRLSVFHRIFHSVYPSCCGVELPTKFPKTSGGLTGTQFLKGLHGVIYSINLGVGRVILSH